MRGWSRRRSSGRRWERIRVFAVVSQRSSDLGVGFSWRNNGGAWRRGRRLQSFAFGERKWILDRGGGGRWGRLAGGTERRADTADAGNRRGSRNRFRRRTAAGFLFVVDDLLKAAVLEEDALVGLDAVSAALEETAGENVGSLVAVIVNAGVALIVDAEAEVDPAGWRDEDAKVGREQDVGILAGKVMGFESTVVDGDHEAAARNGVVSGEMNFCRGAYAEAAAASESDVGGFVSGGDGAVVADEVKQRGEKLANVGYNANTGEYVDMFKAGIVDPARVTKSALQNAASIAGLMLTTEVMITKIDEDEPGNKVSGAVR